ncbi:hypothetical protein LX87_03704 [Larkinella arboricola]|uniref:Uncharacterized protein n=1 Tax=Larkinella arboricola TaxID=643671 RepID=A0A327WUC3_LARAB|nr:hypothetical protein [Larkinella arboricola]RAJ95954.1 hypothetical protein LX87_03704 [Larkinella arboricola]
MKKNAYHYLFGQDTLYQTADPEPIIRKPSQPAAPIVLPEPVAEQPVVEQTIAESVVEPLLPQAQQPILAPEPEPAPEPFPAPEPVVAPAPLAVVETPAPQPAAEKPKVLLLIDEELMPGELIFLENILKAINLSLNDVDMLNLAGSGLVDFHAVLENKTLHHFISFGVPFKTIHLNIQMDRYQPIRIFGITFLLADPLSAIEADQKLKRKLWAVLKQVFLD